MLPNLHFNYSSTHKRDDVIYMFLHKHNIRNIIYFGSRVYKGSSSITNLLMFKLVPVLGSSVDFSPSFQYLIFDYHVQVYTITSFQYFVSVQSSVVPLSCTTFYIVPLYYLVPVPRSFQKHVPAWRSSISAPYSSRLNHNWSSRS